MALTNSEKDAVRRAVRIIGKEGSDAMEYIVSVTTAGEAEQDHLDEAVAQFEWLANA
ncbi:MAG: hypothetical protein JNL41_14985 [Phenylobacterium sp.]|uniref:hypothetical protein n=1 Tax=Phenylobacterium sp. TaxID=1871053 RepID=UPI001A4605CE|nr:hypothetical protein [Phenylobacterium sp.]MBL8555577.1 hypothetical protein [Phenylobacterium sp.]